MRNHLIVYAKRPLPGYAKTRLGAKIGLEESAGVYARLLYRCLAELVDLAFEGLCIELSVASDMDKPYFQHAFPEFLISTQIEGDLGQRFSSSFKAAFDGGAEAVVVVGTDIPDLDRSIIHSAYSGLQAAEVVIGPDMDGGYYLIGTRAREADLFEDIQWSSEFVFEQTEQLIRSQGLSIFHLPTLSDVDTYDDYQRWLGLG